MSTFRPRVPGPRTLVAAALAVPPAAGFHYLGSGGGVLVGILTGAAILSALVVQSIGNGARWRYATVIVRSEDGTVHELDPRRTSIRELVR